MASRLGLLAVASLASAGVGFGIGYQMKKKEIVVIEKPVPIPKQVEIPKTNDILKQFAPKTPLLNAFPFIPSITQTILERDGYVLCYDNRTRNALWTLQHITPFNLKNRVASREKSVFKEDETIDARFRAKLSDYEGSGYDRGHLDVRYSQQAVDDTFWLSNISPQVGLGFNRDYWARFEHFVRHLSKEYKDVYVVTGPLFLPTKEGSKWFVKYQVLGNPPNVAVPTHFYKLVLAVSGPKEHVVGAFVIPNSKVVETTPLEFFSVSFEDLEKMAGVSFFDQLKHKGITFKPLCAQSKCILPPTTFWQKGAKSPTPSAPRRTELAEIDPAILDDEAS